MIKLTSHQKTSLIYSVILLIALFLLAWLFEKKGVRILPYDFFVPKVQAPEVAVNPELKSWMDKLAQAENCDRINGTWDTGSLSWGRYCFKKATWERYASSTRIAPYAETQELMNFIGDDLEQDRVVAYMIESEKGNWKHWRLSTKKIGLPPQ